MDAKIRNSVEAVFGEGKRFYGLSRIMARLRETSETVIAMQLLVMNLGRRLRILLWFFSKGVFILLNWQFRINLISVQQPLSKGSSIEASLDDAYEYVIFNMVNTEGFTEVEAGKFILFLSKRFNS